MNRILVVEDEPGIALALEDSLRLEGHQVQVISEGLAASQCAREGAFDLILLDAMLPGKDGFTICRELRSAGSKTPVIFLSARAQEYDRVRGLDLGANDYVVKPFSPDELMARVRRLLRDRQDGREHQKQFEDEISSRSSGAAIVVPAASSRSGGHGVLGSVPPRQRCERGLLRFHPIGRWKARAVTGGRLRERNGSSPAGSVVARCAARICPGRVRASRGTAQAH